MRYRAPFSPLLTLILAAGTAIGNAATALETYEDFVVSRSKRKLVYTNDVTKRDLPSTRRVISDATARLEGAKAMADHVSNLIWDAASRPDEVLSNRTRARLRLLNVHLVNDCRDIVLDLFRGTGGSALHQDKASSGSSSRRRSPSGREGSRSPAGWRTSSSSARRRTSPPSPASSA